MDQQFMELNTRSLLISAAIAGVAMGLFSNLPLIACLNCLLFGWVWGGGIGAVFLYRRSQKQAVVTNTQGLVLGAAAGIVGAIIGGIAAAIFGGLSAAFSNLLFNATGDIGNVVSGFILSTGFSFFEVIRNIFIYGIIGAIGGLIATALIWKAPTAPLPPYTPPPSGPTA
jgi:MFS family permease